MNFEQKKIFGKFLKNGEDFFIFRSTKFFLKNYFQKSPRVGDF